MRSISSRCRARLEQIADMMLARIPNARRVAFETFRHRGPEQGDALVFFHDDDDWFSPALSALARLPLDQMDVVVFPLVRLWIDNVTFVLPQFPVASVVGRPCPFTYRYHTNNYGVAAWVCHGDVILGMKDHIIASSFARTRNFRDCLHQRALGLHNQNALFGQHDVGTETPETRAAGSQPASSRRSRL